MCGVFAEAKGNGFDVKIMRQVLRLRKMDGDDRAEEERWISTSAPSGWPDDGGRWP